MPDYSIASRRCPVVLVARTEPTRLGDTGNCSTSMSKLCDLNTASNWAARLRVVISARTTPAAPAGAGGTETSNDAARERGGGYHGGCAGAQPPGRPRQF